MRIHGPHCPITTQDHAVVVQWFGYSLRSIAATASELKDDKTRRISAAQDLFLSV
jgi:hypothetical protein